MKRLPVTPYARLATLAMHTLSLHVDGGGAAPPAISDDVKKQIGDEAVTAFKATLPKPPETYDVKLPEGSVLPAAVLERLTPALRELGIVSNEHAQRLIGLVNGEAKSVADRIAADYSPGGTVFEQQRQQYEAAALKAPDLGNGAPQVLQAKVARVTAFTGKYFPDDVRELINKTGLGSHPGFFRAVLKIADMMKEDGFVPGSSAKPPRSFADRIYGDKKQPATT